MPPCNTHLDAYLQERAAGLSTHTPGQHLPSAPSMLAVVDCMLMHLSLPICCRPRTPNSAWWITVLFLWLSRCLKVRHHSAQHCNADVPLWTSQELMLRLGRSILTVTCVASLVLLSIVFLRHCINKTLHKRHWRHYIESGTNCRITMSELATISQTEDIAYFEYTKGQAQLQSLGLQ